MIELGREENEIVASLGDLKVVCEELIKVLGQINPDYEAKKAWDGIGLKIEGNYSCLIAPYEDHLKLMIWKGIELDDPNNVMQGSGKNTRHIKFYKKEDIDKSILEQILSQQFELYKKGVSPQRKDKKRKNVKVPKLIKEELEKNDLYKAYNARPPYQRRDYINWIKSAKRDETRLKRLNQMIKELKSGDKYMKMDYNAN